tara:strand:+ start:63 stop:446 length:384 start_codon:yes stop_codon:yes gene_type:complete
METTDIASVKNLNDGGYLVTLNSGIVSCVPSDLDNTDNKTVLQWETDGGTISAIDEITLDRVRELREPKFVAIDCYYSSRPPTLPSGVTQQEMDDYQDALRDLPSTIVLTGVTTDAAALALFPAFPS